MAERSADSLDWSGDPVCWGGGLTYNICCEDYANQWSKFVDERCWSGEFTYHRCCLAGLSSSEAALRRMRRRATSHVLGFVADDFPDYDCLQAEASNLPVPSEQVQALHGRSPDLEEHNSYAATDFWTAAAEDLHGFTRAHANSSIPVVTSTPETDQFISGALEALQVHLARIQNHINVVAHPSNIDHAIRSCPLGVASLAQLILAMGLGTLRDPFAVQRTDLLLRVILEQFSIPVLVRSRWPIYGLMALLETRIATEGALPDHYAMYWANSALHNSDIPQLEELSQQLLVGNGKTNCQVFARALARGKSSFSGVAWGSLQAGQHLCTRSRSAAGAANATTIALVTLVYGKDWSELVPKYARRLQALGLDAVLLVCGDELAWQACTKHWWPTSKFCIRGKASYSLKYEVPAVLQHAGIDVFWSDFDAIPFKDPREHLRKHHSQQDVAMFPFNAMYLYIRSTPACRRMMRALLRYEHLHGWYVPDMHVLEAFVHAAVYRGIQIPYFPQEVISDWTWGYLDPGIIACFQTGWDCNSRELNQVMYFHLHGTGAGPPSSTNLSPGTKLSNASALLSELHDERDALMAIYCNPLKSFETLVDDRARLLKSIRMQNRGETIFFL
ncbi:unnamed protein product [Polarella glacialis]|uniref:Nucleotide-diphospho-sugar transferase domain-containing protein n=1 Tax=Polarella glacialis TaxID=89957 RepID=A0A813G0H5_POLGL|nr:unnamed protein product [Polarella glacialis]